MPFTPPNVHVDGTPVIWDPDITDNIDAFRAWVNDVQAADVVAASIPREALVKPRIALDQLNGGFQFLAWYTYGLDEAVVTSDFEWGGRVERFTLVPIVTEALTRIWRLPAGWTFELAVEMDIEAHMTFEWLIRHEDDNPTYPDGAGGPANAALAGYFALHCVNRATGVDTVYNPGRNDVIPLEDAGATPMPNHNDHGICSWIGTLAAGRYDVFLAYHVDTAPLPEVERIDVSRVQGVIEGV